MTTIAQIASLASLALLCFGMRTESGALSSPEAHVAQPDAIGSVLAAFETHPIVAITESHWNVEIHEFLRSLASDPRFRKTVDDIVVEFGCASHQGVLDRYIAGEDVSIEELRPVWRDTAVSPQMTWDAPVYARFFETIREVNLAAARDGDEDRLRVLAGDPPIDWSEIDEREQLLALYNDPQLERDVHFSRVVEREVLARGRRALLISGSGHLTRRNLWVPPAPNPSPDTTTVHLLRNHPESVFVIKTLGTRVLEHEQLVARLSGLAIPSITLLKSHWLGDWPASDFAGVRRYNVEGPGKWPFEGLLLSEVADAALFLGTTVTDSLPPFGYQDEAYRGELNRRRGILGAPELTRIDQGIVEVEWRIDAGRFDDAIRAIDEVKSWDPESSALDDRLIELHGRIEALGG